MIENPSSLQIVETSPEKIGKPEYEKRLRDLQIQALMIQQAYFRQKRKAVIIFEGWDSAGKGGTIRRFTEKLDPRGVRVHLIGKPDPELQAIHYLYRFWVKLPKPGKIAIFDRSWYGRVLVERIEGYCKEDEWRRAYQEINETERQLVNDGVRIVKIFLHCDQEEQIKRFKSRFETPEKAWKLTEEDFRNLKKRDAYEEAINDMLTKTSYPVSWHVQGSNDKKTARINVIEKINEILGQDMDITPPGPSEIICQMAKEYF